MDSKLRELGFTVCSQQQGFSGHVGPFYEKQTDQGWLRAMELDDRHMNPEGVVHGGVLLCFADYILYRGIGDVLTHDINFATINLESQFLAAAKAGQILYGNGSIVRDTRSIVFAQGKMWTDDREVMYASGIWKKLGV